MSAHGVPRATGDLDVWVQPDPENAERVWAALLAFGAPVQALGLSKTDLVSPNMVFQMGVPPQRIERYHRAQLMSINFVPGYARSTGPVLVWTVVSFSALLWSLQSKLKI